MEFKPAPHSTQAALGIIVAGIGIATLGTVVLDWVGIAHEWVLSIRLLTLMTVAGPLVWLMLNMLQQRTGIKLTEQAIALHYPLPWFDRQIEYPQIAISVMINANQLAVIWLKPRRTAPGDDPLPPRPVLLISTPVNQAKQCQQQLEQLCPDQASWTPTIVQRMVRQRRWLRRGLGCLLTPIVSFGAIFLIARIIMAFLRI